MSTKTLARLAAAALFAAVLALAAGCTSKASGDSAAAKGAVASATANPTVSAEMTQAKALVAHCFAGTPVQQVHQVHLVFASSATGKNGPAVVAARDKLFSCLHISDPAQRQAFTNAALTAAEHGHLTTHAGRVTYFEVTLPQLVLQAGNGASPSASASATGSQA